MSRPELLELEHAGWKALCVGTGADFYGSLMIETGIMILANGVALSRDEVIVSLADAPTWDGYEIRDERILSIDDDNAILTYTGTAWRGNEPKFQALMSSVYTKIQGEWRMVLYQQTPIP